MKVRYTLFFMLKSCVVFGMVIYVCLGVTDNCPIQSFWCKDVLSLVLKVFKVLDNIFT